MLIMFGKTWIGDSPFSKVNYMNYMYRSSVADENSASKMRCTNNIYKI